MFARAKTLAMLNHNELLVLAAAARAGSLSSAARKRKSSKAAVSEQMPRLESGSVHDVALRIGTLADSSLVARRLAIARLIIVGAPDYLRRTGVPQNGKALSQHAVMQFTGLATVPNWVVQAELAAGTLVQVMPG
jgi:DNA-binding transcriptional LysR family regulator